MFDPEEKEILEIKITKKCNKYFIEMGIQSLDFKKEEVLDLINRQFNKFIIKEDDKYEN